MPSDDPVAGGLLRTMPDIEAHDRDKPLVDMPADLDVTRQSLG
ncbi:MAG: hypothetical protein O2856_14640 [Planctomycetota bacterium]|nr:hypothetical protein [Planctomycetota bacterium]